MPLIKRYPNRKLYDTEAKRYVTLDEIAAMVRAARDVQVVDHESGEDVTSLTLTQIIVELEKKSSGHLSSSLLAGLIRSGGNTLEGIRRSVQQSVSSLGHLGRVRPSAVEEQVSRLFEQGKLSVEQAQNLLTLDGLLTEVLHSLNVPTHRDLRTLQDQIESLSARLTDMTDTTDLTDGAPVDHQPEAAAPASKGSQGSPSDSPSSGAPDAPATRPARTSRKPRK